MKTFGNTTTPEQLLLRPTLGKALIEISHSNQAPGSVFLSTPTIY